MVELRKRPAPKETAAPAPAAKRAAPKSKVTMSAAPKAKTAAAATIKKTKSEATNTKSADAPKAKTETKSSGSDFPLSSASTGKTIALASLNSEIKLNTDKPTSITNLLSESDRGIVIFSYPKASTPGCTTQACLFRDSYTPLTESGLAVYGLSADSPKSNTTFVTKQNLPYPLLCDADGVVSGPLGLKKPNPAKGTVRGVVVITKNEGDEAEGTVEVHFLGGPQKTLDVVLEWVEKNKKAAKL